MYRSQRLTNMVHGMSIKSNTLNNMSSRNINMDKTINDNDIIQMGKTINDRLKRASYKDG